MIQIQFSWKWLRLWYLMDVAMSLPVPRISSHGDNQIVRLCWFYWFYDHLRMPKPGGAVLFDHVCLGVEKWGEKKKIDFFSTFHCLVGSSLMELNFHFIKLKILYSLSMAKDFKFFIYWNAKIPILSSKQN